MLLLSLSFDRSARSHIWLKRVLPFLQYSDGKVNPFSFLISIRFINIWSIIIYLSDFNTFKIFEEILIRHKEDPIIVLIRILNQIFLLFWNIIPYTVSIWPFSIKFKRSPRVPYPHYSLQFIVNWNLSSTQKCVGMPLNDALLVYIWISVARTTTCHCMIFLRWPF